MSRPAGREISKLDGERFGRLLVVRASDRRSAAGNVLHECLCDCGKTSYASKAALVGGKTVSCGCQRRERVSSHRMSKTKIYDVWLKAISRCENSKDKDFKNYGGRGISMCAEWRADFSAFSQWAISAGYQDGLTIDRKETNGNYEPGNCRFISIAMQQRNKRTNRMVRVGDKDLCLEDAIALLDGQFAVGVSAKTVRSRVSGYGWSFDRAISTPLNSTKGFAAKQKEGAK